MEPHASPCNQHFKVNTKAQGHSFNSKVVTRLLLKFINANIMILDDSTLTYD